MSLVKLVASWLAESMQEEQIFPLQTNYAKRYAEIWEEIQLFFFSFNQEEGSCYCWYPTP